MVWVSWFSLVIAVAAALFAGMSAVAAFRSERHAQAANADGLGPSVIAREVTSQSERFFVAEGGEGTEFSGLIIGRDPHLMATAIPVGQVWSMPRDAERRVHLRVAVRLANEGRRTAFLRVEGCRYSQLDGAGYLRLTPDEGIGLAPGATMTLVLFPGVSLGEWDQRGREHEPIETEATITAWVEPSGSTQRWSLSTSALYFDPEHGNDSSARIVPSTPPVTKLTPLSRVYPESQWRQRRGSPPR